MSNSKSYKNSNPFAPLGSDDADPLDQSSDNEQEPSNNSPSQQTQATQAQAQATQAGQRTTPKRSADDADLPEGGSDSKKERSLYNYDTTGVLSIPPGKLGNLPHDDEGFTTVTAKHRKTLPIPSRKSEIVSEKKTAIGDWVPDGYPIEPGMIVWGPLMGFYRQPPGEPNNSGGHILDIPNYDYDKVHFKKRFHIVLRTEKHHVITVPCFTFGGKGLREKSSDRHFLCAYLKVIRSGALDTSLSENEVIHKTKVLRVEWIHNEFKNFFLETPDAASYAHFLAPCSLDSNWRLRIVGKLEQGSFRTLRNFFADHFRDLPVAHVPRVFPWGHCRVLAKKNYVTDSELDGPPPTM